MEETHREIAHRADPGRDCFTASFIWGLVTIIAFILLPTGIFYIDVIFTVRVTKIGDHVSGVSTASFASFAKKLVTCSLRLVYNLMKLSCCVSGRLYPVNERAVRTIKNLYVANERVCFLPCLHLLLFCLCIQNYAGFSRLYIQFQKLGSAIWVLGCSDAVTFWLNPC